MTETKPTTLITSSDAVPDPLAFENLLVKQNFGEQTGVKQLLTVIPVRKPGKQDWVRVHPDEAYRGDVKLIQLEAENELYVVPNYIADQLPGEIFQVTLYTAVTRQGVVTLWPIRIPEDGQGQEWARSQCEAAEVAMKQWVRIRSDRSLGAYRIDIAPNITVGPNFPDKSFPELLRIAFKDRVISSLDHPVVAKILGLK